MLRASVCDESVLSAFGMFHPLVAAPETIIQQLRRRYVFLFCVFSLWFFSFPFLCCFVIANLSVVLCCLSLTAFVLMVAAVLCLCARVRLIRGTVAASIVGADDTATLEQQHEVVNVHILVFFLFH